MSKAPKKRRSPLTRRHTHALGLIVTRWAILEDMLRWGIVRLFFKEEIGGFIVTGQMEYRHKRDIFRAWISVLQDAPAIKELASILDEIERLSKIRLLAAHRMWVRGRKPGAIKPMSFESRGNVRMRGHDHNEPNFTAEQLEAEAKAIERAYGRFTAWIDAVAPIPAPVRPKIKRRSTKERAAASPAADPPK